MSPYFCLENKNQSKTRNKHYTMPCGSLNSQDLLFTKKRCRRSLHYFSGMMIAPCSKLERLMLIIEPTHFHSLLYTRKVICPLTSNSAKKKFLGHILAYIKICHNCAHVPNWFVTVLLLTNTALYSKSPILCCPLTHIKKNLHCFIIPRTTYLPPRTVHTTSNLYRAELVVNKRNETKKVKTCTQILIWVKMWPIKEKENEQLLILWPIIIPYSNL